MKRYQLEALLNLLAFVARIQIGLLTSFGNQTNAATIKKYLQEFEAAFQEYNI